MVSTIMCSLGPDKILPQSLAIPCKGGSIFGHMIGFGFFRLTLDNYDF